MRRRSVLGGTAASFFLPALARAQGASKIARIGVLVTASKPHPIAEALRQELAALGYVEGTGIVFDVRYADRNNNLARMLARELVNERCDVIVTHFTPATKAAKEATSTIPIVMAAVGAPVETGLVASLARPGGNITGVTNLSTEIAGRRVQVLRDIIPNLNAIAVVVSRQDPFNVPLVEGLTEAGSLLGVKVEAFWREKGEKLEAAFARLSQGRFQAALVSGVNDVTEYRKSVDLAAARQLPTEVIGREAVAEGGLISVVGSSAEIYRRVAALVDRILKGDRPADLPVEQPTTVEMIVNVAAARRFGLTVPTLILTSADEVIE